MDKRTKILIIEDSATQALRLKLLLEEKNYHVTIAQNGKIGLDLVKQETFPIVLTDWIMPEMSGVEFCRNVRRLDIDNYIYIIIVTAKEEKKDIFYGLKAGADDYITKPVDFSELIARLETGNRILNLEKKLREERDKIVKLMITDPLTKMFNRRYMNEKLPSEIKRAIRYHRPLSVIMGDIDHFKDVNDQYGHLAGDEVLEKIAGIFLSSIRKDIDWTARYGGEEFLIVLPETSLKGALTAADNIRTRIMNTKISYHSKTINVTMSFGVSCMVPSKGKKQFTIDAMLNAADKFLYQSKENGRNQCNGGLI